MAACSDTVDTIAWLETPVKYFSPFWEALSQGILLKADG